MEHLLELEIKLITVQTMSINVLACYIIKHSGAETGLYIGGGVGIPRVRIKF